MPSFPGGLDNKRAGARWNSLNIETGLAFEKIMGMTGMLPDLSVRLSQK